MMTTNILSGGNTFASVIYVIILIGLLILKDLISTININRTVNSINVTLNVFIIPLMIIFLLSIIYKIYILI